jgi:hypothetical protein
MKKQLILFFIIMITGVDSCIDRFEVNSLEAISQLVVDGQITDAPGPYTVKLTRTKKPGDFSLPTPVSARVTIFDNVGNSEVLTQINPGEYQTDPNNLRGVVGREYFVQIEIGDKTYESVPEKINPSGTIDSVYHQFEKYVPESGIPQYRFRIFMDSHGTQGSDNFLLRKVTGTYEVITRPELYFEKIGTAKVARPRPCSGFVLELKTGKPIKVGPCTCCQCWVSLVPTKPNLSDNSIVANGQFNKVDLGFIPVEFWPFWQKTLVIAEQISLTKTARDYWKTVQDQKEGAASLFQPSVGKARSNVFLKNGAEEVQGIFYASGVAKKIIFLSVLDIPLGPGIIPPPPALPPRYFGRDPDTNAPLPEEYPTFVIQESCLFAFKHSTTQQPLDWK